MVFNQRIMQAQDKPDVFASIMKDIQNIKVLYNVDGIDWESAIERGESNLQTGQDEPPSMYD